MKIVTYDGLKTIIRSFKTLVRKIVSAELGNLELGKFITQDQFTDAIDTSNVVFKGNVATLNGESILNGGNIEIDSSVFKIVTSLPTENVLIDKIYLLKSPTSTATRTDFDEWKYEDGNWVNLGAFGSVQIDMSL